MAYRAVIFDLGGVVMPSPLDAFRAYEQGAGLPHRFISEVIVGSGDAGAWSRLERGRLTLAEFGREFEAECAAAGRAIDVAEVLAALHSGHEPRPAMLEAIACIRDKGLKTAALTNNWVVDQPVAGNEQRSSLFDGPLFDVVIESSVEGMRKPDPRIYELACERLTIAPNEAVFLDDLGVNLKPARTMGMATIKVGDPDDALSELEGILGFQLSKPDASSKASVSGAGTLHLGSTPQASSPPASGGEATRRLHLGSTPQASSPPASGGEATRRLRRSEPGPKRPGA